CRPGIVSERLPELANAAGQHRGRDVGPRPDGVEELVLRDEPPGPQCEIFQHGKRLRPERYARATAEEATARAIEPVRPERDHLIRRLHDHISSTMYAAAYTKRRRPTKARATRVHPSHAGRPPGGW